MKYLVTGGTGSFGSKYVEHLLKTTDADIRVFSRGEYLQWEMKQRVHDNRVKYIIGDVRDVEAVYDAMDGVDYCVHAAALKHVSVGESQPWEAVQTNINGTKNVVDAANEYGAKMVLLSTDKAVEPVNLYGATKMAAEKITLAGCQRVTRWGNVFGSRGSVLHIFKKQAANGSEFSITDKRMTRFVITFDEAIDVVDYALFKDGCTVTLPSKLRAINITDLALAFDESATFKEIGIQKGEKIHEVLSLDPLQTSEDCGKMSVEEIRGLISESV